MPVHDDRRQILHFLAGVRRLLAFLVTKRLAEESQQLYINVFATEIVPRFDSVAQELQTIDSEGDRRWIGLRVLGLLGESLRFKVGEFFSWLSIGKVRNILKSANSILGSLSKVFAGLDPIKEFKDHLELRIGDDYMNSTDDEITRLGL
jgi:hypothetical protein